MSSEPDDVNRRVTRDKLRVGRRQSFNGMLRAKVLCRQSDRESNPGVERWERTRNYDAFLPQSFRHLRMWASCIEENEICHRRRVTKLTRLQKGVPLCTFRSHRIAHVLHMFVVGKGCARSRKVHSAQTFRIAQSLFL